MTGSRARRSRTGCLSCRQRKVKCDETRPKCNQCTVHRFSCEWPLAVSKTSEWGHTSQSIPSALTTPHTECANSLTLNPQDRLFLAYFSSSTVYCFYDFHEWGILQYLVKEVAPTSRLITRMFLALSASEMYNKGLLSSGSSADDGLRHYTLCLTEFQAEISASTQKEPAEAMIAALFFMIHYELKFTGSLQRVRVHLRGLWALVSTHPLFRQQGQRQTNGAESDSLDVGVLNPSLVLSCQLIAWIIYLDIAATSFGASCSLIRLLGTMENTMFQPRLVNKISRLGNHTLWGDQQPATYRLTDIGLYRPVELGYEILFARFNIWDLRVHGLSQNTEGATSTPVLNHLLNLGEKYCDILHMAEKSHGLPYTPNIETLSRIATFYWSAILFHRRMLCDASPQTSLHKEAVSKITRILYYRYHKDSEKRRQIRVVWPTFMVAIETHDPIHRGWMIERLAEARGLSAECEKLWGMANDIIRQQEISKGFVVDLGMYMQP